ncbi:MAG: phosphatase PAP2 family protein [Ignavibacteriaceae bacterium]
MRKESSLFILLLPNALKNKFISVKTSCKVGRRILQLTVLLTILYGSTTFAQNPVLQDSVQQFKYNFSQFGNETWDFIKQPTKWDGTDWLKIGLITAGTFLVIETADQPARDAVLREGKFDSNGLFIPRSQKYYKSVPIELGRMWGELYAPVILFSGFAIHSLLTDDITTRKIAYEIGQASIYTGVVTLLLKTAIGRARPYMNEGKTTFHIFSSLINQDYHSLPGGHTAAAFVLSTVLSRNAKPVWLKVLAYVPATLTFVSRVYQDQHWASDDFLGAALGYFIATWVVDQHENNESIVEMSSIYPISIRIVLN